MSPPLLQAEALTRHYGTRCAVDALDFALHAGEVVGFLGPNGAGKSTTLQMLAGVLAPTAGSVTIAGHDLLAAPREARAAIGYLPDRPPLYPDLTVDEQLTYAARLHGLSHREAPAAVARARGRCDLDGVARRLIGNLSKGFRQRVGIAQAIVHSPQVLLLDEPTSGLDPHQLQGIRALLRELARDHALLLSSHNLAEVQASCDRVLIIRQGRLLLDADTAELRQRLAQRRLLLGLQQPPALSELEALPDIESVESLAEGRFRLHHAQGSDPAAAIAAHCVAKGWGLCELTPEQGGLEQLFLELTQPGVAA